MKFPLSQRTTRRPDFSMKVDEKSYANQIHGGTALRAGREFGFIVREVPHRQVSHCNRSSFCLSACMSVCLFVSVCVFAERRHTEFTSLWPLVLLVVFVLSTLYSLPSCSQLVVFEFNFTGCWPSKMTKFRPDIHI